MPTLDYLYITRLQPFWATVECGTEKTVRDFLAQVKLSHYALGAACYSVRYFRETSGSCRISFNRGILARG